MPNYSPSWGRGQLLRSGLSVGAGLAYSRDMWRKFGFCLLICLMLGGYAGAQAPDTDGDGIPDSQDACPNTPARGAILPGNDFYGCVDVDFDDIADRVDDCPEVPGVAIQQGCPPPEDRDGDGIPNTLDACPDTYARGAILPLTTYHGCSDIDFDGVADEVDACPTISGLPEYNGCKSPSGDSDGDGVIDAQDACPTEAKSGAVLPDTAFYGCPDRDGDGIADKADACPDVAGVAQFGGCAEANQQAQAALQETRMRASLPAFASECLVMPNALNTAVNVRQIPAEAESILRSIPDTASYRAIGQAQDTQGRVWYVLADGGWVASWVLDVVGPCANLPQQDPLSLMDVLPAPVPVQAVVQIGVGAAPITPDNAPQLTLMGTLPLESAAFFTQLANGRVALHTLEHIFLYGSQGGYFAPQGEIDLASAVSFSAINPAADRYVIPAFTAEGSRLQLRTLTAANPLVIWGIEASQAVFSPDGQHLVTVDASPVVNFLQIDGSGNDTAVAYNVAVRAARFAPHGALLAFLGTEADAQGVVLLVDPQAPTLIQNLLPLGAAPGAGMAFDSAGTQFAVGLADGSVLVWLTPAGALLNRFAVLPHAVRGLAFSPDGRLLAVLGMGEAALLDVATGAVLVNLPVETGTDVIFSEDGRLFLVAGKFLYGFGVVQP